jgi:hypothetical protein
MGNISYVLLISGPLLEQSMSESISSWPRAYPGPGHILFFVAICVRSSSFARSDDPSQDTGSHPHSMYISERPELCKEKD